MKMNRLPAIFCLSLFLCAAQSLAQQTTQNHMPAEAIHTGGPAAAQAAVDVWLGLVDDAQYAKAWQSTSSLFQRTIPREQWANVAQTRRAPLGKMLSRKLTSAIFATTLPGAPAGQYVVVQYDTSFEHKKTARETATAMLDIDGQWRLSGYFVR